MVRCSDIPPCSLFNQDSLDSPVVPVSLPSRILRTVATLPRPATKRLRTEHRPYQQWYAREWNAIIRGDAIVFDNPEDLIEIRIYTPVLAEGKTKRMQKVQYDQYSCMHPLILHSFNVTTEAIGTMLPSRTTPLALSLLRSLSQQTFMNS